LSHLKGHTLELPGWTQVENDLVPVGSVVSVADDEEIILAVPSRNHPADQTEGPGDFSG